MSRTYSLLALCISLAVTGQVVIPVLAHSESVSSSSIATPQEAWQLIQKDVILIDVRTPEEFEKEHLKGSILIPYDEIEARVGELGQDRTKAIVLYCASGRRAGKAAASLRALGFTSVVNAGGYDELAEATPKDCSNPVRC